MAAPTQEYEALEQGEENMQVNKSNNTSSRNRIVSVVAVALVMTGGAFLVASSSRGSVTSSSVTNLVQASAVPQQEKLPMKGDRVEGPKVAVVEKKGEGKEVDGGKPVAKKTSKPTVKPTTPPKPTVPPTTKKPSEKNIQHEEVPKGKAHPARSLGELGNPTPKTNPATTLVHAEREEGPKGAAGAIEKKGEVKEAPKDVEVDGGKPVAKKTSKPTVKPTTPPKPTVPPTTKKPSEKKEVLTEKVEGPKQHPASRMLAEVRGKVTPSSSSSRGGKGKTEKPVEGPPAPQPRGPRQLADVKVTKDDADPCHDGLSPRCTPPTSKPVEHASKQAAALPRTLAAVKVTKDDADPCHDGLSPRCTPPTSKPVEHKVSRRLAGSPTKSPSSGLHKPTWKPSSKPNEHRALKSAAQKAAKEAAGTHYYEIKAKTTKDVPDSGLNSAATDAVVEGEAEAEVVEVSLDTDFEKKEDKRESRKADKKAREEAEATGATVHSWNGETRRSLAGSPTKSPSSGLHKPTWKPSSKPNEHRELQKKDADPCHDGLSPRCTPPTSKPVEHRSLAGSPTKSPSSGLHKPTWKPSSKPNEA